MNLRTRVAIAAVALVATPAMVSNVGVTAVAATSMSYGFLLPPIASAGSIAPGQTVTFSVRVLSGGTIDPGGVVYLGYFAGGHVKGDSTTVPPAQCNGVSALPAPGSVIPCTADSTGHVALTYHVPAQPPAQGRADWVAQDSATNPSTHALDHYVYTTVYRFNPSPIAPPASLAAGQPVSLTLTARDGLNQGIPGATVYLSFRPAAGGGRASAGATALTGSPTLFTADSSGAIHMTYTTPASLPAGGQDAIVAQDLATSPTAVNSDSYAFTAATAVVSVGDATVVEGDQLPGTPANFTVTMAPAQPTAVTVQYITLCGIGDKGCGEDFIQVSQPISVTIPANATSTTFTVTQFAYIGGHSGETFNEGWYVQLVNPPAGTVLGRSVGDGMLLPDVENTSTALPDLYVGDEALVPTLDSGESGVFFTVTLGAKQSTAVSFTYATADGTAVAGTDYTAASGIASIAAGKTSAVVEVLLLPNAPPTSSRTFSLTISNASGNLTIARSTGTGTILPD